MGDPDFLAALDVLRAMHLSKGHDYADLDDPLRNYVVSGTDNGIQPWRAAQVRLSEKYHRLVNLTRKGATPNHESLDDTLLDIAALALIVRSLRNRPDVSKRQQSHACVTKDREALTRAFSPAPCSTLMNTCACAQGDGQP